MHLNNKGFAISSILYSILIMAIMLILGVLFSLFNRKIVFDKLKHDVINELNNNMNMSIATIKVDSILSEIASDPSYNIMSGVTASETKNGITTDLTDNITPHVYDASGNDITDGFVASIPGRYTVKYDVMDSNNNLAQTKSRVLVVDDYSITKGVNVPLLAKGMVPIKWNGSAWVDTTASDNDWYNYDTTNKKWANARTTDGSMWVWIPRYIYKITSGWHSNTTGTIVVQFSKGINDNWNSSSIGNIDTGTTSNASNNKWTNHPAFTFGSTQLTGIWVAKFEASKDGSDNVKALPNVSSWIGISVNDIFNKVRSMETNSVYGWGTSGSSIDTHMMKNSEWSAAAYLSKSTYGKNDEIWINNSSTLTTGCSGNSVSEPSYSGCENTYNTANGQQASTTGNIYGIYDMSGGAWEFMSAYINNGDAALATNGNSSYTADGKYKNVYAVASTDSDVNNYALAISSKGDAIYETSSSGSGVTSWYSDYSHMPSTNSPWFTRGGSSNSGVNAGVFYFDYFTGSALSGRSSNSIAFRPVLIVGQGL